jgi:N-glycosylase/DNA lyase
MKSAIGIGPKQASLFLRNIGYTDELAILDKHVLAYMGISGLAVNLKKAVNSLKGYKDLENILQTHARKFGLSLGYVDQAIWIVMRVYAREASI